MHAVSLRTPRARVRQRRFLIVSVAALAVLGAAMGVSFLGSTGTVNASVSGSGSGVAVYPVSASETLPTNLSVSALKASGNTITSNKLPASPQLPKWTVSTNTAGSVTTDGDIAVVDACLYSNSACTLTSGNSVLVNLFVTNMGDLQPNYSSYALPVEVWETTGSGAWTQVTTSDDFLTNTSGELSFSLQGGEYYDIYMPTGGSWYAIGNGTSGALAPAFYVTAQQTS